MLGLEHNVNRLVEHDPGWKLAYEEERGRLKVALAGIAHGIEHVGSSAVPGLRAKPILDIDIGILPLAEWERCLAPLIALGYDYAATAGVPGHHIFGRGDHTGERSHLLHVIEYEGADWRSDIAFRDALRADPQLCRAYEEVKQRAVLAAPTGRGAYNDFKRDFITEAKARLSSALHT